MADKVTPPSPREFESREDFVARATRALVAADVKVRDAHAIAFAQWDLHVDGLRQARRKTRTHEGKAGGKK